MKNLTILSLILKDSSCGMGEDDEDEEDESQLQDARKEVRPKLIIQKSSGLQNEIQQASGSSIYKKIIP